MSNGLTAWVRTVVPALWAALVAWLVSLGLPDAVTGAAAGLVDVFVVPTALAFVYAGLRWLEKRVPRWLAVVLLGSAKTPVYGGRANGGLVSAGQPYVVGGGEAETYRRDPGYQPPREWQVPDPRDGAP